MRGLLLRELGAAGYVMVVYVTVVIGGGALLRVGSPSVPLAVLATALVAITLEPVRRMLGHRLGAPRTDALRTFAGRLAAVPTAEVAPRMAKLVAEATGDRRVEIWLTRAGATSSAGLVGRWPVDALPITDHDSRVLSAEVRHQGVVLGRIVREPAELDERSPVEQQLVDELVNRAGAALHAVALERELTASVAESQLRATQLQQSRRRIVDTADDARRRLERDIHDGAQQHLVALSVNLSLAATVAGRDPSRAAGLIADLKLSTEEALRTLDDLSRGVYPPLLVTSGIGAALRSVVDSSPVPVLVIDQTADRSAAAVETACYFGCLEVIQNAVKHSAATAISVVLSRTGTDLCWVVSDDGVGFDPAAFTAGSGLTNLSDRLASLGGTLTITSSPHAGSVISGRIPVSAADV